MFNNKQLKEDLTIRNANIIEMSEIFVIDTKGTIGG